MKATVYKHGIPFKLEYTIIDKDIETIDVFDVYDNLGNDLTVVCECFDLWKEFEQLVAQKYINNEI